MISKKLAQEVLNVTLETGADYSEIYIENRKGYSYRVDTMLCEKPSANFDKGAAIRIMKGLQVIYGYTNDVSRKGLLKLANDLSRSFEGERIISVTEIKKAKIKQINKVQLYHGDVSNEVKVELLRNACKKIMDYDETIVRSITSLSEEYKNISIFTSEGMEYSDERVYTRLYLMALASKDGRIENSSEAPGAQMGYEFINTLNIDEMALNVARVAVSLLDAKECPSGRMPVVIGNGFGGVLFHEACGHALEASSVSRDQSVFSNRLGEQIASPLVNAFDDGTIPNAWGSLNYDDEGRPSERVQLIKDGVLVDYMVDDFNGRRMDRKGNGHSRRQNYRYEPTSRMTNTYIDNGESTVEEIIASTTLGLYAKSLGGGSVNPATGEFNFGCSEAYIIRDGKICEQVKGAILIGTGEEILKNIDMVGNDLKFAQGMCGASSGSVPTIVGQPTLRVKQMVVGGRGGELK